MRNDILIRQETHKDYKEIISLILRSFSEGTDYSDGTDIIALVEEIRDMDYILMIEEKKISLCLHPWPFMPTTFIRELVLQ